MADDDRDNPAFPRPYSLQGRDHFPEQDGISTRLYVATKLAAGLIASGFFSPVGEEKAFLSTAVSLADMLITECNK